MKILVFGGSGNVGRPLVSELLDHGAQVRVVSRAASERAQERDGLEHFAADMNVPNTLSAAFDDVDRVFLLTPMGPNETHLGLTVLSLILEKAPEILVYLSSDLSVRAPQVPHAGSKVGIEAAIRASGLPHVIFRPTYFMQNDLLLRDALADGVFPIPLGPHPVARVDVRDVAEAAATALLQGKPSSQPVLLSSRDQPNGQETADLWSEALNRKVMCPDLSPEGWAASMQSVLPAWMANDLMLMYRAFQTRGHPLDLTDLDRQADYLNKPPSTYRQFMEDCAGAWSL